MKPITQKLTPKAMKKYLVEEIWPKKYVPFKYVMSNHDFYAMVDGELKKLKPLKKKPAKGLKTKRVRPRAYGLGLGESGHQHDSKQETDYQQKRNRRVKGRVLKSNDENSHSPRCKQKKSKRPTRSGSKRSPKR